MRSSMNQPQPCIATRPLLFAASPPGAPHAWAGQAAGPVANLRGPLPAKTISDSVAESANTVVSTTAKAQASTTRTQSGSASGGGSGEQAPNKGEERKDEKKTTSTAEVSGAKKNEPATKMYCN